jgi:hypothetical protein
MSSDDRSICWRAWPCAKCSKGATPIGFLGSGKGSNPPSQGIGRNEQIDSEKKNQAGALIAFVSGCAHTAWEAMDLPFLAQGSEHLVLYDAAAMDVVKITLTGTYGDFYEIINGAIHQFDCAPVEYLRRLDWWEQLFTTAPKAFGITRDGAIVSRQKFIVGDANPPQEIVNDFLRNLGAMPVRESCWLWKKTDPNASMELWIGDARSDNFVLTDLGIVPIDIRIWGV